MNIDRAHSVRLAWLLATAAAAAPAAADIKPHAGMLRYPDVGPSHIVFVYASDLWLVDRAGGVASPLASPPGLEMFPKFDPEGRTIAFSGNYDGNRDLYTIPVEGGVPARVTHHPSRETLTDWTPDGRLIFSARGIDGMPRAAQLFTVDAGGGLPGKLPVPYGAAAAISPDGTWLAYTPYSRDARSWKRYRGGMASDIWLLNLETHASEQITDWEGTDSLPMWHGRTVYYLSDQGPAHKLNIWSYDHASGRRRQVTEFDAYDVKWPSIGPGPRGGGEIVFQNGSSLYLLDLPSGRSSAVTVSIPGARPALRPHRKDASERVQWWHISSTGKRAVVQARGDVWTLPAEHGSPRNLTRTSGTAEREPSWSPDGRWIAYFSDATGEYELYITQSDGKGETRQLTRGSRTFYNDPVWSPDSEHILYTDKASNLYLTTLESGATLVIDKDPWGELSRPSWSHDSRWIAYHRTETDRPNPAVWVYEVETRDRTQLTSGMFADRGPVFDRMGDYLYFTSTRSFTPTYSDVDTSFIYHNGQVVLAVPLLKEIDSPYKEESDEEKWGEDDEEEEDAEDEDDADEDDEDAADDADGDDEDAADDADEDEDDAEDDAPVKEDDGVTGTWEGTLSGGEMPPGMEFVLTLTLGDDGTTLTGSITVPMGSGDVRGTYEPDTGAISGTITTDEGTEASFTGTISGSSLTMTVEFEGQSLELRGDRTAAGADDDDDAKKKGKAREVVEIDVDGFERRAMQVAVPAGRFGQLAVNDKNQLIYVRFAAGGTPSIMLFDLDDDDKEEKTVAKGAGAFEISADGKRIILARGSSISIQKASAGATGKNVVMTDMTAMIDPRDEWRQVFTDAWRLERDFLYVDNMHGVDWEKVRERYEAMLDDCATRADVGFVIREMIAELNIGHAYYRETSDVESGPTVGVGLLGVDWELAEGAYRIARIHEGAAWDVDARNPLREAGVDVKEGDWVLAVNGIPLDTAADPWAAFVGTAGRTITITVSEKPVLDDDARDVAIKPLGSESNLRYRAWIERNRAYVEAKTDGRVGYIYVPDTGRNGQNDLVRQYFCQIFKPAMIIDERWNGGGQIPSRFIEMMNRPVTNYWARRDNEDAPWPPDAHHGPKCMLINGRAGSGGDLFPWFFRDAGLGKLVGTRTWGGLVGISGNPGLIDGSRVTVPTFGFYERDGTWGVEGHGVDPDLEVIDDPALMTNGGDPQLDAAIALMLDEIERNPYIAPHRPSPPDRSGMGIREEDK